MEKTKLLIFTIIIISFAAALYVYPSMPADIVSHWNMEGEADGYIPKLFGLFLMPVVIAALAFLFTLIPKIDPLKPNINNFRRYYDGFVILMLVFMLAIQFLVILWNSGIKISPNIAFPLGIGFLFFYVGVLCENSKRNWFIGIRTPWTLSSDIVWDKTNKLAGKLFKIAGTIAIAGVFFRRHAIFFVIIPALAIVFYAAIYSYFQYKNQKHAQKIK